MDRTSLAVRGLTPPSCTGTLIADPMKGTPVSETNPDGTTPAQPAVPPVPPAPNPYGSAPTAPQPPAYGSAPEYGQARAYGQAPAAYGTPPAYGQAPGYTDPYGSYAPVKTNTLAVISMVASIVGFLWILPFIGSLAGVIMGHISLRQIAASGEKGRGMALAGLIVGYVGLALFVIGIIAIFAFFAFAASQGSLYTS